jgi:Fic family protein
MNHFFAFHDTYTSVSVESLIYAHQDDYYLALQQSTKQANSAPFIEFILQMILDSCNEDTPPNQSNKSNINPLTRSAEGVI